MVDDSDYVIPCPNQALVRVRGGGQFPVHRIYCVGQNYADHAREMGSDPDRVPPFFFSKPADAVSHAGQIPYPPKTEDLHHEVELVVAMGRAGQSIPEQTALDHVYGYALGIDLTRRDLQLAARQSQQPWDMAKGFDQSAPLSEILPAADIGHPKDGSLELRVNGELRQTANLSQMIWRVPEIVTILSGYVELMPGDLIFSGTPAGIGVLHPGDRLDARLGDLLELTFEIAGS